MVDGGKAARQRLVGNRLRHGGKIKHEDLLCNFEIFAEIDWFGDIGGEVEFLKLQ